MTAPHTPLSALPGPASPPSPAAPASTAPRPAATAPLPAERRRVSSRSLLGQQREIEIEHAGQIYRLSLTSLGKLILTK